MLFRSQDLKDALAADPLLRARQQAMADGVSSVELDALDARAQAEADAAIAFAQQSAWPEPQSAYTDIQTFGAGIWR